MQCIQEWHRKNAINKVEEMLKVLTNAKQEKLITRKETILGIKKYSSPLW